MVIPVYKKSKKDNLENNRPISLTCICCKVMEHVILSHLNNFTSENNILSTFQHGFRAGLFCETQLIIIVHDWASTINRHGQVDALLLDFSKAFDKVSHVKLLHKLNGYGIRGKTYNWISSFLLNRSQFVSVNGSHSSYIPVTSGVPQGSVLGPALFLLFINDITSQSSSQLRLFADDTVMYRTINSFTDHQTLQDDLTNLSNWAKVWQMKFNVSKCHLLSITNKRKPSNFSYTINEEVLPKSTEQDYLGVRCSSNLRWGAHCSKISDKANKVLGLIRRTLKPCSKETKEKAYFALVRPILEYAAPVWNPYTDTDVNRIEQVQKNAARFVTNNYNPYVSSSDLVNTLNWDTLEQRRLNNQTILFYKFHNNLINLNLPESIELSSKTSRFNSYQYKQLQANISSFNYSFFPRSIRIWNKLPNTVCTSQNVSSFKAAVKPAIRSLKLPNYLRRL